MIECPNCEADVELIPADETDSTTVFNGECPECKSDITVIVRYHPDAA